MIEELPSRTLAYRFTHELVRRALYDRLTGVRRAELHLRVGEALERADGRSGRALADLAHHFAAAAPLGGAQRGVDYNVLAARAATAALAFDEAVARLRTALELRIESPHRRAEVLLELGTAGHRAGKALDALEAFGQAAEIARELADADLLARAAIGYEDACWRPGIADRGRGRAARGGDRRAQRRELGAARPAARRARPGARLPGRSRPRARSSATSAVAMARRLDDRAGLATVLMRAYWSRGTSSLEEILEMLTEAMALGEELGDTEIRAEAMSWRVPTFVALGDVDAARREVAVLQETAEQTAQPFMLHVAEHYGSAIALVRRPPRRGRGDGAALARVEPAADRARRLGRLRDPDVRHPPRAGAAGGARAGDPDPGAAQDRSTGPWRPGLVSVLVELGMDAEARRELSRVAADGLDGYRESLWLASLTYLTDACTALGDEATAALVYPELEPLAGDERDDRPPRRLLRRGRSLPRHARRHARRVGARRGALRARDGAQPADGDGDVARPHALPVRPRRCSRAATAPAAAPLLAEAAALAEGSRLPALLGRIRALGAPAPAAALPDGLSSREVEILGLVARGLSNREIGGEPVDQRAHRRQPHPQHPAQDRLRQPHRGRLLRPSSRPRRGVAVRSSHAPVRHRAQLRRGARAHERRRQADRGDQRRRGRPLGVLVPQRRPAPDLLPVRGAVVGRDPRRRAAGERARRRRSSRSTRPCRSSPVAWAPGPPRRPAST